MTRFAIVAFALLFVCVAAFSAETQPNAAQNGYKALTQTAFTPGHWSPNALPNAWKQWGIAAPPANYDTAVMERYGLHPAPYPNGGLPMGLRKSPRVLAPGVGIDCMLCHAGSIMGKSYIGLGNTSLDIHSLFEDLSKADGLSGNLPLTFSNVRGTSESTAFGVFLLGHRNPDLTLRTPRKELGLRDDQCDDAPAWWHFKKKKTLYLTGTTDSRSVRTMMQFMLHPLNMPKDFEKHEPAFRDIRQYLISIEPPKYPFALDKDKAAKGHTLFKQNCAKCHGTYGANWTYPNKIIPLDEIGTDPTRHKGVSAVYAKEFSESWLGQEKNGWFANGFPMRITEGYQAPPLDGVWATAPYLHNGSVPTLNGVLNSGARPKRYTRSFKTDEGAYDKVKLGWKVTELRDPPSDTLSPHELRKIYDTSKPGRGNAGHIYGDDFTDEERTQVIEYLKTL